jgi:hypothetical protein
MKLQKSIQEFLGPTGLAVLQKALKQTDVGPEALNELMESMQILPRAVISWTFNVAKSLGDSAVKKTIPSTDYAISIKKNDKKYDFEIIKKTEVVVAQKAVELPAVILKILELNQSLDSVEKGFNDNLADLQKAVDFLVKKFHFDKSKITVTIAKSESSGKCQDCGQTLKIGENHQKMCLCFRFLGKSLYVKKNDQGDLNVSFSGKWDKQNVFLLMKSLKAKI